MKCAEEETGNETGKEGKGKFKTSISLNYYLKERLDEEIELGTFVSNSDAIGTALSKLFGHIDERRKLKESKKISDTLKELEDIIKTDEGKKVVEEMLNKKRNESEDPVLFDGDPEDYPRRQISQ